MFKESVSKKFCFSMENNDMLIEILTYDTDHMYCTYIRILYLLTESRRRQLTRPFNINIHTNNLQRNKYL